MSQLDPHKLHVRRAADLTGLRRKYTLTHSDLTGDLYLTIAREYDHKQISGLYTRLMRDEVLAEWLETNGEPSLHIHVHVSGGIVFGSARLRSDILHHHMPMVLEAIRHGDRELFAAQPELERARVQVHFAARQPRYNTSEDWGTIGDYRI